MNDAHAYSVTDSDYNLMRKLDCAVNEAKLSQEWRDGFVTRQIKQREAELRGEERGRAEGRVEGRAKKKKLLVLKMLARQLPVDLIADLSGLSTPEVDEILAEMTK